MTRKIEYESFEKGYVKCVGEKTPEYMYHKKAMFRIKNYNPGMKIIVCLREPIARAFSHWNMAFKLAINDLASGRRSFWTENYTVDGRAMSFEEVVVRDLKNYYKFGYIKHNRDCLMRGFYYDQLEYIYKLFPKKNVHVVISERLMKNQKEEMSKIFKFLGVDDIDIEYEKEVHSNEYNRSIGKKTLKRLKSLYSPKNYKLYRLLGYKIKEWEK